MPPSYRPGIVQIPYGILPEGDISERWRVHVPQRSGETPRSLRMVTRELGDPGEDLRWLPPS